MTYTTEKPKTPGWYWYRIGPELVNVVQLAIKPNCGLYVSTGYGDWGISVGEMYGQFAGPIPEPREPCK